MHLVWKSENILSLHSLQLSERKYKASVVSPIQETVAVTCGILTILAQRCGGKGLYRGGVNNNNTKEAGDHVCECELMYLCGCL